MSAIACAGFAPHPRTIRKSGSIGRARREDPWLHPHRKRFNDPISVDLGEVAAAAARVLGQSTQAHSDKAELSSTAVPAPSISP